MQNFANSKAPGTSSWGLVLLRLSMHCYLKQTPLRLFPKLSMVFWMFSLICTFSGMICIRYHRWLWGKIFTDFLLFCRPPTGLNCSKTIYSSFRSYYAMIMTMLTARSTIYELVATWMPPRLDCYFSRARLMTFSPRLLSSLTGVHLNRLAAFVIIYC